ncbi:hypothetical protein [Brevibacterium oceani]|nr:hypothetical protein [Brevibacterium oceani]
MLTLIITSAALIVIAVAATSRTGPPTDSDRLAERRAMRRARRS